MKAAGLGFEEVTPSDVLLVDWHGTVLVGSGKRHSEYPIHTEIMRARSDVNAVVHTHPPHALAFAALGVPLRPISHEATVFVPPDIPRFTLTGDLITTPDLGKQFAGTLGDRPAILLVHHGIVGARCSHCSVPRPSARASLSQAAPRDGCWRTSDMVQRRRSTEQAGTLRRANATFGRLGTPCTVCGAEAEGKGPLKLHLCPV
ncbi:class II aldolase/adducin family protein [Thermomicrobium sp. CFH 73360]|uniref:class II aldolase/adducin family protein n=1 Tax=Thermomicrobium sp. CFH 73360 TaxID=2951987 RepID=UPI0020766D75|nr:class II aldolase/adducin family protein [Thermomicrobium sp. CFH 73360]MCM8745260.1 class II aldolase/adducin family protein [Thermomicrobium sp. CFH 73360]